MSSWKMVMLGEVCEIISGSTPNTNVEEYWNGNIKWITPAEIKETDYYIDDTKRYITESGYKSASLRILPKGTVLLTSRAPIGKVAISRTELACNQGFKNLICSEIIHNRYLYYFLKNNTIYLNSLGRGATFKEISKKIVEQISIPLPPLEVQNKIADILDKASELIEKRKTQIAKLDELTKSIFIVMFGDPMKNSKGWEVKKLEEICDICRGGSPRPISDFLGGTIPWIKIGDATKGSELYLDKTKEYIIESGIKKSRLIHKGSLIFANCGVSLGFARIIRFDGCIHDGWLSFENIQVNKIFLLKSLNHCTDFFRKSAPDGTQPNLNTSIMKKFIQIIPPIELQNKFANIVEKIEEQKALLNQGLEKLELNYKSLMQKIFKEN